MSMIPEVLAMILAAGKVHLGGLRGSCLAILGAVTRTSLLAALAGTLAAGKIHLGKSHGIVLAGLVVMMVVMSRLLVTAHPGSEGEADDPEMLGATAVVGPRWQLPSYHALG